MVVLGISPTVRSIGIAVIYRGELIKWQTRPFAGKWSEQKIEKIIAFITEYIETYSVTGIAIKVPDNLPIHDEYARLLGAINVLCEQKLFLPVYYSLSEIKKCVAPHHKVTKKKLFYYLLDLYPDVQATYEREQVILNSYHDFALEAVAVAHCLYHNYLLK